MNYQEINEDLLNRIISAAYGEAGFLEKLRMYWLVSRNDEVRKIFDEYRNTAETVYKLKHEECPAALIENMKSKLEIKEKRSVSLLSLLYSLVYKPTLRVVMVILIISALISVLLFNRTENKEYSKEEIQLAEDQVKSSLVLVNRIFERTADTVENDILKGQVAKPVRKGVLVINDLFKGG